VHGDARIPGRAPGDRRQVHAGYLVPR
jgi:hypothetical protein